MADKVTTERIVQTSDCSEIIKDAINGSKAPIIYDEKVFITGLILCFQRLLFSRGVSIDLFDILVDQMKSSYIRLNVYEKD